MSEISKILAAVWRIARRLFVERLEAADRAASNEGNFEMSHDLLAVYATDSVYDTPIEEAQPRYDATDVFTKRIMAAGSWVFAGGLDRLEMATVVDGTGPD